MLKKGLSSLLVAISSAISKVISKGNKWLLEGLHNFLEHPLDNIWKGIKSLVTGSITLGSWFVLFEEFGKKILGYLAVITGISSGTLSVKQIFDFSKAVLDPQKEMLNWLADAFSHIPSIQTLITSLDSFLTNFTSQYFTPTVTFTYLLQVTAIGECFNQYLQALISTLIFVFSMFIIRWAFANNFTFTKEVPKS